MDAFFINTTTFPPPLHVVMQWKCTNSLNPPMPLGELYNWTVPNLWIVADHELRKKNL